MKILSIETSCDETALAIIEAKGNTEKPEFKVLSTTLYSQTKIHEPFGGVFPMLAKREHVNNILPLFSKLELDTDVSFNFSEDQKNAVRKIFVKEPELAENFIKHFTYKPQFDLISVTQGPGLEPALWVGLNFAKALSFIFNIPLMPVNHMEGHILSVLLSADNRPDFPAVALLISGGHTEIVLVNDFGQYKILGATRDDAVGETFDKVARLLELPYPGGPEISKMAEKFSNDNPVSLPRPMIHSNDYDFSFSGLKTAVLYLIDELKNKNLYNDETRYAIAHEFQKATTEVLFHKTDKAIQEYSAKSLIIGGGVIANKQIRETFMKLNNDDFKVYIPEIELATDNAVMIGFAGYINYLNKKPVINPLNLEELLNLKALGNLSL